MRRVTLCPHIELSGYLLATHWDICAVREDVVEEGSEGLEENVGSVLVTVIGNTVRSW